MFSDKFIVSDTYSLLSKEYLYTSDIMPWMYTSLFDDQYLPVLDQSIKDKLNSFFEYKFIHSTEGEPAARKELVIKHVDGSIKGFEIKNRFKYITPSYKQVFWNHFCNTTKCPELIPCKERIDKMTSDTDILSTKIFGITYDENADFSGIIIFDSSYDLGDYQDNDGLAKINDYCRDPYNFAKGVLVINQESDFIMRMSMNYPSQIHNVDGQPRVKKEYGKRRDWHIQRLLDREIITEDQAQFVRELSSGNTKIDLEFFISSGGEITDIHVRHYTIHDFKDLTSV